MFKLLRILIFCWKESKLLILFLKIIQLEVFFLICIIILFLFSNKSDLYDIKYFFYYIYLIWNYKWFGTSALGLPVIAYSWPKIRISFTNPQLPGNSSLKEKKRHDTQTSNWVTERESMIFLLKLGSHLSKKLCCLLHQKWWKMLFISF